MEHRIEATMVHLAWQPGLHPAASTQARGLHAWTVALSRCLGDNIIDWKHSLVSVFYPARNVYGTLASRTRRKLAIVSHTGPRLNCLRPSEHISLWQEIAAMCYLRPLSRRSALSCRQQCRLKELLLALTRSLHAVLDSLTWHFCRYLAPMKATLRAARDKTLGVSSGSQLGRAPPGPPVPGPALHCTALNHTKEAAFNLCAGAEPHTICCHHCQLRGVVRVRPHQAGPLCHRPQRPRRAHLGLHHPHSIWVGGRAGELVGSALPTA